MAIHQCAHCARKIDDQEDSYEAHEVVFDTGTHWRFYHSHCLDDLRSSEHKLKAMGKKPKQTLPKEVRAIKASWTGQTLL